MEQDATWKGIVLVAAVACAVYCFIDVSQPPKTHAKSESESVPDKRDDTSNYEPELDCGEPNESDESEATPNCESDEWLEVSEVEIPEVEVLEINAPDAHIKN